MYQKNFKFLEIHFRSILSCIGLVLFCLSQLAQANSTPTSPLNNIIPAPPALAAKSYMLIDYSSDFIIDQQNMDQRVEPASLTKMMTVYIVDQALKTKKINLQDKVKVSDKAWRSLGSRMFLEVNSEVSVEDLLKGIIIQSGNDASIALAEHIAGTEESFSELMNYYAKELGMTNTHFVNATGLPDPNHYTSARDMAILGKAIIRDFPESYSVYKEKEFTYKDIRQSNRNRLLWRNEWVDGIKTGHTDSAGFCLVASGQKDGMRLIAVVMGAKTDLMRTDETNKLLSYGFRFYETRKLYPGGSSIKDATIWMGTEKQIKLGLKEDLYITIGRGQYERVQANLKIDDTLKAPMNQGTPVGLLSIQLDEKTIAEKPIIALHTVEAANFLSRWYDAIHLSIQNLWKKVSH